MAADNNKYIAEAYKELVRMSGDEEKQLEYEAREMLMRDHISFLYSAEKKGRSEGRMEERISLIIKMFSKGYAKEKIAELLEESPQLIERICEYCEKNPELSENAVLQRFDAAAPEVWQDLSINNPRDSGM